MLDAAPELPFSARGIRPFVLGALSGAAMGWVGCFVITRADHVPNSGLGLLAVWFAVTIVCTACLPTLRTRAAFLIGSVLGFGVGTGGLHLLAFLVSPIPNTYPG